MVANQPVSSLTLQIFFFLDGLYIWAYFFLSLALFVYRGYTYNYDLLSIGFEILGVFLLFIIQQLRLFLGPFYAGSVGNKTETITPLLVMLFLMIPSAIGTIYYLALQTYVYGLFRLLADLIINGIILFFLAIEFLFSLIAIISFKGSEKNQ
jgi:hypothetical protein